MSNATTTAPLQLAIDGKWIVCTQTDEYGVLGQRYLCTMGQTPGQPTKKLLLRSPQWRQVGTNAPQARLTLGRVSEGQKLGLRPVQGKTYQQAVRQQDGSAAAVPFHVLQQDITGLVSLKKSVQAALRAGEPQRIWQLFYHACRALDDLGARAETNGQVPLQCPPSLAVGPNNQIVPLDAEVRIAGNLSGAQVGAMYRTWFGDAGRAGFANPQDASLLHGAALLQYFRFLLGNLQNEAHPDGRPALARVMGQLNQMQFSEGLTNLESQIRDHANEWDLPLDDEEDSTMRLADGRHRGSIATHQPAPGGSWPARLLLLWACLSTLLVLILLLLFALWPGRSRVTAEGNTASASSGNTASASSVSAPSQLLCSHYSVVFLSAGTTRDKVSGPLRKLFPGEVSDVPASRDERAQLLETKKAEWINAIKGLPQLKELLSELLDRHSIRFHGFSAASRDQGLSTIVERGGVFTLGHVSAGEIGSLLQPDGVDRVIQFGKPADEARARTLLGSLSKVIAEYASYKDALAVVGSRQAFLVRVEPTAEGHARMRKKLLSQANLPLYLYRPNLDLFDAIAPTGDGGEGDANYALVLDRTCYWRLAGHADRQDVRSLSKRSKERLKWKHFDPKQTITWKPILLTQRGRPANVTTFDIAVPVRDRVAVFRNQQIWFGESRQHITRLCKQYINSNLKLDVEVIEDAINIRSRPGQVTTATLRYSYLAEQARSRTTRMGDLEVYDKNKFDSLRKQEDAF